MSSKFEQLLDLLVNEEHEKANELFHEIVVEKSREIYDTMIAEEAEEDESVEEAKDEEEDESVEEASEEDEEDESVEEGFGDSQETMYEIGGDDADGFVDGVEAPKAHDEFGSDEEHEEGGDEPATKDDVLDIADALEELKAEFAALLAGEKHEEEENPDVHGGELDNLDSEEDGEDDGEEFGGEDDQEEADEQFMREYREVVGKPHAGGKVAGSSEEASTNKSSVVSSAKGRPTTGATAGNIAQAATGEDRKAGADGKSLAGSVKGEFTKGVEKNISSKASTSMKDGAGLNKVAAGHGAEKKGSGESSVNDKNTLPK